MASGCSSYLRDGREIVPQIDYRIHGQKLIVEGTLSNNSGRAVTFVRHSDFSLFSLWAEDRSRITEKNIMVISYAPAEFKDLETIRSGESIHFEEAYEIKQLSPNLTRVTEYPASEWSRSFTMRDTRIRAKFSYGFYKESFPWLGRFFRPGVLLDDISISREIDIK